MNLKAATIRLRARDTRTDNAEVVPLTTRVVTVLEGLPRSLAGYVFVNPETGKRWQDIRKLWRAARKAAGMPGLWFHDLRRSGITAARRAGVAESVIMRMSGHKTRAVFDRCNVIVEDDLHAAARMLERAQAAAQTAEEAAG